MGLPNPSYETKFSGTNGDREVFIFPVQLTTSRIGNLTRLILTLAICVTIPYRKTSPDDNCERNIGILLRAALKRDNTLVHAGRTVLGAPDPCHH